MLTLFFRPLTVKYRPKRFLMSRVQVNVAKLKEIISAASRKPTWFTEDWVDEYLTDGLTHTCRTYTKFLKDGSVNEDGELTGPWDWGAQIVMFSEKAVSEPITVYVKFPNEITLD